MKHFRNMMGPLGIGLVLLVSPITFHTWGETIGVTLAIVGGALVLWSFR